MCYKKKLQMGVAAMIALAACSDRVDSPLAPAEPRALPVTLGAGDPADQGRITITRTTERRTSVPHGAPGDSLPTVTRVQAKALYGTGRVALRNEDARMRAALNATRVPSITNPDDRPVLGLSLPAGRPTLRETILPWRRSAAVPDEPGSVIEMTGVGDAPPSTIRYMRGGVVVAVIEQQWELWKRQWNLTRRESSTADGSFREVIEVARSGQAGTAIESPVEWAQARPRLNAGRAAFDLFGDEEAGACDMCATLRANAVEALATSVVKDFFAGLACALAPTALTLPACAAALGVASEALVKATRAAWDLMQCERNPPPCPKKETSTTDCSVHAGGNQRGHPSFDCGGSTDGGISTGGTGGDNSTTGHNVCTYYYEYDLYTGDVTFSQLLYCTYVAGP